MMKWILIAAALASAYSAVASAQVTPPATARQQQQEIRRGDPPRWYQEDRTERAQLATLRKDISAALQEALQACKQAHAGPTSDCVREARATYQEDMANLRELHLAARDLSKTYETSGK
jgi:hypothetical protein